MKFAMASNLDLVDFFVAAPLGFESETVEEIREVWPYLLDKTARVHDLPVPEVEIVKGGIELRAEMFAGLQLNFFLKTANRILWRLRSFPVHDFQKLFTQLQKVNPRQWLGEGDFALKVAARESKLGHERQLKELALKAWKIRKEPDEEPAVYIRLDKNICTISLDTTGDHLHRRGNTTLRAEAPVRETIAAYCLRKMIHDVPPAALRDVTLWDPMCGSGTFLSEAVTLWRGSFARPFRFQQWKFLPKLFQQKQFAANYKHFESDPFGFYFGSDIDPESVEITKKNLAQAKLPTERATFATADVTKSAPWKVEGTWIICNPPYGERLQGDFQSLFDGVLKHRPARLGILWTADVWRRVQIPSDVRAISEHALSNGGLHTIFKVLEPARAESAP